MPYWRAIRYRKPPAAVWLSGRPTLGPKRSQGAIGPWSNGTVRALKSTFSPIVVHPQSPRGRRGLDVIEQGSVAEPSDGSRERGASHDAIQSQRSRADREGSLPQPPAQRAV